VSNGKKESRKPEEKGRREDTLAENREGRVSPGRRDSTGADWTPK